MTQGNQDNSVPLPQRARYGDSLSAWNARALTSFCVRTIYEESELSSSSTTTRGSAGPRGERDRDAERAPWPS